MPMTNFKMNEKNWTVLNAILREGFNFTELEDEPNNVNQVISRLIKIAMDEGYIPSYIEELFDSFEKEDGEL